MSEYTPDKWIIVDTGGCIKVFATWYGGFTRGDSWKLSSGALEIKDQGNYWVIPQHSGSVYNLHCSSEGTSGYTNGVLAGFLKDNRIKVITIEQATKLLKEGAR